MDHIPVSSIQEAQYYTFSFHSMPACRHLSQKDIWKYHLRSKSLTRVSILFLLQHLWTAIVLQELDLCLISCIDLLLAIDLLNFRLAESLFFVYLFLTWILGHICTRNRGDSGPIFDHIHKQIFCRGQSQLKIKGLFEVNVVSFYPKPDKKPRARSTRSLSAPCSYHTLQVF